MSLKDICSQEAVDYRSYISWRKRNGLVLDRREMEVEMLIEFLDRIKPMLCLN